MLTDTGKIIIGTRASLLAVNQAEYVKSRLLKEVCPQKEIEIKKIKTKGDKILDVPLAKIGGKGLFVKEIETALLSKEIDLAVHSMKDMPAKLEDGLKIGAVTQRETPFDVIISKDNIQFEDLKDKALIGTSSLRRAAQILYKRPDIKIASLRGNVETRLRKLKDENLDAIVLAGAGLKRLGMDHLITQYLDIDKMVPAVGQGALCIEIRDDDQNIQNIVSKIDHNPTNIAVTGERAFLNMLGGSCQVPVAGYATVENSRFTITAAVGEIDGSVMLKETGSGSSKDALKISIDIANKMIARGADKIISKLDAVNYNQDGERR